VDLSTGLGALLKPNRCPLPMPQWRSTMSRRKLSSNITGLEMLTQYCCIALSLQMVTITWSVWSLSPIWWTQITTPTARWDPPTPNNYQKNQLLSQALLVRPNLLLPLQLQFLTAYNSSLNPQQRQRKRLQLRSGLALHHHWIKLLKLQLSHKCPQLRGLYFLGLSKRIALFQVRPILQTRPSTAK
jgi:hypothetical protein